MSTPVKPDLRRSTRVPLEVSITVVAEVGVLKGVTIVVNLHGALIRTVRALPLGSQIELSVYITGKTSPAQVVYVTPGHPLTCGIELQRPQNIWGVSLVPDDWDQGEMVVGSGI